MDFEKATAVVTGRDFDPRLLLVEIRNAGFTTVEAHVAARGVVVERASDLELRLSPGLSPPLPLTEGGCLEGLPTDAEVLVMGRLALGDRAAVESLVVEGWQQGPQGGAREESGRSCGEPLKR